MSRQIEGIIIQAGYAKALKVERGQIVRICQVDGKQTDLVISNAYDLKEHFCSSQYIGSRNNGLALSSCPSDLGVLNEGRRKPLAVKIFEAP